MEKQAKKKTKIFIWGLSKKEFVLNIILPLAFLVVGGIASPIIMDISSNKKSKEADALIEENRIGGRNQEEIRAIPQVQVYQRFLNYVQGNQLDSAWTLLTADRQGRFGGRDNIDYDYFLTNRYNVKYIMPESQDKFFFFLEFTDAVDQSEVKSTKAFLESVPIVSNGQEAGVVGVLQQGRVSEEMFEFIKKRFIIEDETIVRQQIDSFLSHRTMTELVASDWRTPILIAKSLNLKPKDRKDCKVSVNYPQNHMIIQSVVMQEDGEDWKIQDIHTETISRWSR